MASRPILAAIAILFCLTACHTNMTQTPPANVPAVADAARNATPQPPVAAKKPHQVDSANGTREDEYYWLRADKRLDAQMRA